jgi:hypothetical protein
MVVLDEAIEQCLERPPSHLAKLDSWQFRQNAAYGGLIDLGWLGAFAESQGIVRGKLPRREREMARSLKLEHKGATHLIAKLPVFLQPVPSQAQPAGKLAATLARVLRDEGANEGEIILGNCFASVGQYRFHAWLCTMRETGTQGFFVPDLLQFFKKLDRPFGSMEIPDEGLELMGIDPALTGPTGKAPAGEPLVAEPKALAVIPEHPKGGLGSIAENEKSSAERIGIERLPTDPAQSVNAGPKVNGIDANENTHLRGDLYHRLWLKKRSIR